MGVNVSKYVLVFLYIETLICIKVMDYQRDY